MDEGLRTIIEAITVLIGAGGITAFITTKAAKRKLSAEAKAVESNSFLELVDRMEVRLDKQDKEIVKLQEQVERLIEKVTQLEERNRAKDLHILTLTERIKYLVKLLKGLLVQMKNAGIVPKITLPSWIDEYRDCEDEE
jgi:hypothetical protein